MSPNRFRRVYATVFSIVYLSSNVLFAHVPAVSLWEERFLSRHSRENSNPALEHVSKKNRHLGLPIETFGDDGLARFGSITDVLHPAGLSKGTVFHFQDLHMQPEAQRNISAAIAALAAKGKIGLIALEGAEGPIRIDALRSGFSNAALAAVADAMLEAGDIGGPYHALLAGREPLPDAIGIDDMTAHARNVSAFRGAQRRKKAVLARLADQSKRLSALKEKIFSPELLAFDNQVESYRSGKLSLADYARALSKRQGAASPQIKRFLETLALESSIDFEKVKRDRVRLQRQGGPPSNYPLLQTYLRYATLADGIDTTRLLKDLRAAEIKTFAGLAASPVERKLIDAGRALFLRAKIANFELTPAEWDEYRSRGAQLPSPVERFYMEAYGRDAAMAKNMLAAMRKAPRLDSTGLPAAALVTGGFHSPGVDRKLVEAGYTVVPFLPKITRVETAIGPAYLNAFLREKSPLEKIVHGQKLFLSAEVGTPSTTLGVTALATANEVASGSLAPGAAAEKFNDVSTRAGLGRGFIFKLTKTLGDIRGEIENRAGAVAAFELAQDGRKLRYKWSGRQRFAVKAFAFTVAAAALLVFFSDDFLSFITMGVLGGTVLVAQPENNDEEIPPGAEPVELNMDVVIWYRQFIEGLPKNLKPGGSYSSAQVKDYLQKEIDKQFPAREIPTPIEPTHAYSYSEAVNWMEVAITEMRLTFDNGFGFFGDKFTNIPRALGEVKYKKSAKTPGGLDSRIYFVVPPSEQLKYRLTTNHVPLQSVLIGPLHLDVCVPLSTWQKNHRASLFGNDEKGRSSTVYWLEKPLRIVVDIMAFIKKSSDRDTRRLYKDEMYRGEEPITLAMSRFFLEEIANGNFEFLAKAGYLLSPALLNLTVMKDLLAELGSQPEWTMDQWQQHVENQTDRPAFNLFAKEVAGKILNKYFRSLEGLEDLLSLRRGELFPALKPNPEATVPFFDPERPDNNGWEPIEFNVEAVEWFKIFLAVVNERFNNHNYSTREQIDVFLNENLKTPFTDDFHLLLPIEDGKTISNRLFRWNLLQSVEELVLPRHGIFFEYIDNLATTIVARRRVTSAGGRPLWIYQLGERNEAVNYRFPETKTPSSIISAVDSGFIPPPKILTDIYKTEMHEAATGSFAAVWESYAIETGWPAGQLPKGPDFLDISNILTNSDRIFFDDLKTFQLGHVWDRNAYIKNAGFASLASNADRNAELFPLWAVMNSMRLRNRRTFVIHMVSFLGLAKKSALIQSALVTVMKKVAPERPFNFDLIPELLEKNKHKKSVFIEEIWNAIDATYNDLFNPLDDLERQMGIPDDRRGKFFPALKRHEKALMSFFDPAKMEPVKYDDATALWFQRFEKALSKKLGKGETAGKDLEAFIDENVRKNYEAFALLLPLDADRKYDNQTIQRAILLDVADKILAPHGIAFIYSRDFKNHRLQVASARRRFVNNSGRVVWAYRVDPQNERLRELFGGGHTDVINYHQYLGSSIFITEQSAAELTGSPQLGSAHSDLLDRIDAKLGFSKEQRQKNHLRWKEGMFAMDYTDIRTVLAAWRLRNNNDAIDILIKDPELAALQAIAEVDNGAYMESVWLARISAMRPSDFRDVSNLMVEEIYPAGELRRKRMLEILAPGQPASAQTWMNLVDANVDRIESFIEDVRLTAETVHDRFFYSLAEQEDRLGVKRGTLFPVLAEKEDAPQKAGKTDFENAAFDPAPLFDNPVKLRNTVMAVQTETVHAKSAEKERQDFFRGRLAALNKRFVDHGRLLLFPQAPDYKLNQFADYAVATIVKKIGNGRWDGAPMPVYIVDDRAPSDAPMNSNGLSYLFEASATEKSIPVYWLHRGLTRDEMAKNLVDKQLEKDALNVDDGQPEEIRLPLLSLSGLRRLLLGKLIAETLNRNADDYQNADTKAILCARTMLIDPYARRKMIAYPAAVQAGFEKAHQDIERFILREHGVDDAPRDKTGEIFARMTDAQLRWYLSQFLRKIDKNADKPTESWLPWEDVFSDALDGNIDQQKIGPLLAASRSLIDRSPKTDTPLPTAPPADPVYTYAQQTKRAQPGEENEPLFETTGNLDGETFKIFIRENQAGANEITAGNASMTLDLKTWRQIYLDFLGLTNENRQLQPFLDAGAQQGPDEYKRRLWAASQLSGVIARRVVLPLKADEHILGGIYAINPFVALCGLLANRARHEEVINRLRAAMPSLDDFLSKSALMPAEVLRDAFRTVHFELWPGQALPTLQFDWVGLFTTLLRGFVPPEVVKNSLLPPLAETPKTALNLEAIYRLGLPSDEDKMPDAPIAETAFTGTFTPEARAMLADFLAGLDISSKFDVNAGAHKKIELTYEAGERVQINIPQAQYTQTKDEATLTRMLAELAEKVPGAQRKKNEICAEALRGNRLRIPNAIRDKARWQWLVDKLNAAEPIWEKNGASEQQSREFERRFLNERWFHNVGLELAEDWSLQIVRTARAFSAQDVPTIRTHLWVLAANRNKNEIARLVTNLERVTGDKSLSIRLLTLCVSKNFFQAELGDRIKILLQEINSGYYIPRKKLLLATFWLDSDSEAAGAQGTLLLTDIRGTHQIKIGQREFPVYLVESDEAPTTNRLFIFQGPSPDFFIVNLTGFRRYLDTGVVAKKNPDIIARFKADTNGTEKQLEILWEAGVGFVHGFGALCKQFSASAETLGNIPWGLAAPALPPSAWMFYAAMMYSAKEAPNSIASALHDRYAMERPAPILAPWLNNTIKRLWSFPTLEISAKWAAIMEDVLKDLVPADMARREFRNSPEKKTLSDQEFDALYRTGLAAVQAGDQTPDFEEPAVEITGNVPGKLRPVIMGFLSKTDIAARYEVASSQQKKTTVDYKNGIATISIPQRRLQGADGETSVLVELREKSLPSLSRKKYEPLIDFLRKKNWLGITTAEFSTLLPARDKIRWDSVWGGLTAAMAIWTKEAPEDADLMTRLACRYLNERWFLERDVELTTAFALRAFALPAGEPTVGARAGETADTPPKTEIEPAKNSDEHANGEDEEDESSELEEPENKQPAAMDYKEAVRQLWELTDGDFTQWKDLVNAIDFPGIDAAEAERLFLNEDDYGTLRNRKPAKLGYLIDRHGFKAKELATARRIKETLADEWLQSIIRSLYGAEKNITLWATTLTAQGFAAAHAKAAEGYFLSSPAFIRLREAHPGKADMKALLNEFGFEPAGIAVKRGVSPEIAFGWLWTLLEPIHAISKKNLTGWPELMKAQGYSPKDIESALNFFKTHPRLKSQREDAPGNADMRALISEFGLHPEKIWPGRGVSADVAQGWLVAFLVRGDFRARPGAIAKSLPSLKPDDVEVWFSAWPDLERVAAARREEPPSVDELLEALEEKLTAEDMVERYEVDLGTVYDWIYVKSPPDILALWRDVNPKPHPDLIRDWLFKYMGREEEIIATFNIPVSEWNSWVNGADRALAAALREINIDTPDLRTLLILLQDDRSGLTDNDRHEILVWLHAHFEKLFIPDSKPPALRPEVKALFAERRSQHYGVINAAYTISDVMIDHAPLAEGDNHKSPYEIVPFSLRVTVNTAKFPYLKFTHLYVRGADQNEVKLEPAGNPGEYIARGSLLLKKRNHKEIHNFRFFAVDDITDRRNAIRGQEYGVSVQYMGEGVMTRAHARSYLLFLRDRLARGSAYDRALNLKRLQQTVEHLMMSDFGYGEMTGVASLGSLRIRSRDRVDAHITALKREFPKDHALRPALDSLVAYLRATFLDKDAPDIKAPLEEIDFNLLREKEFGSLVPYIDAVRIVNAIARKFEADRKRQKELPATKKDSERKGSERSFAESAAISELLRRYKDEPRGAIFSSPWDARAIVTTAVHLARTANKDTLIVIDDKAMPEWQKALDHLANLGGVNVLDLSSTTLSFSQRAKALIKSGRTKKDEARTPRIIFATPKLLRAIKSGEIEMEEDADEEEQAEEELIDEKDRAAAWKTLGSHLGFLTVAGGHQLSGVDKSGLPMLLRDLLVGKNDVLKVALTRVASLNGVKALLQVMNFVARSVVGATIEYDSKEAVFDTKNPKHKLALYQLEADCVLDYSPDRVLSEFELSTVPAVTPPVAIPFMLLKEQMTGLFKLLINYFRDADLSFLFSWEKQIIPLFNRGANGSNPKQEAIEKAVAERIAENKSAKIVIVARRVQDIKELRARLSRFGASRLNGVKQLLEFETDPDKHVLLTSPEKAGNRADLIIPGVTHFIYYDPPRNPHDLEFVTPQLKPRNDVAEIEVSHMAAQIDPTWRNEPGISLTDRFFSVFMGLIDDSDRMARVRNVRNSMLDLISLGQPNTMAADRLFESLLDQVQKLDKSFHPDEKEAEEKKISKKKKNAEDEPELDPKDRDDIYRSVASVLDTAQALFAGRDGQEARAAEDAYIELVGVWASTLTGKNNEMEPSDITLRRQDERPPKEPSNSGVLVRYTLEKSGVVAVVKRVETTGGAATFIMNELPLAAALPASLSADDLKAFTQIETSIYQVAGKPNAATLLRNWELFFHLLRRTEMPLTMQAEYLRKAWNAHIRHEHLIPIKKFAIEFQILFQPIPIKTSTDVGIAKTALAAAMKNAGIPSGSIKLVNSHVAKVEKRTDAIALLDNWTLAVNAIATGAPADMRRRFLQEIRVGHMDKQTAVPAGPIAVKSSLDFSYELINVNDGAWWREFLLYYHRLHHPTATPATFADKTAERQFIDTVVVPWFYANLHKVWAWGDLTRIVDTETKALRLDNGFVPFVEDLYERFVEPALAAVAAAMAAPKAPQNPGDPNLRVEDLGKSFREDGSGNVTPLASIALLALGINDGGGIGLLFAALMTLLFFMHATPIAVTIANAKSTGDSREEIADWRRKRAVMMRRIQWENVNRAVKRSA